MSLLDKMNPATAATVRGSECLRDHRSAQTTGVFAMSPVARESARGTKKKRLGPRAKTFMLGLLLRADVTRLALDRREMGADRDVQAMLTVAGHAIEDLKGMRQRHRSAHEGLDFFTASAFLKEIGATLHEDIIMEIVHRICASREQERPFRMTMELAGKLLRLTLDERSRLQITQMEAFTETAEERKERKERQKKEDDRARAEAQRRAAGAIPRVEYEASSISREAEEKGVNRSTIYRRRKRNQSNTQNATGPSQTSSCERPRRTCCTAGRNTSQKQKGVRDGGAKPPPPAPGMDAWFKAIRAAAKRDALFALSLIRARSVPSVGMGGRQ